ncbi:MAG: bifunctional glycosyltransferase family 2/GtrA family protein [Oscillospiraceae bacterium]|nr:bifunctional glycosyltransferase family 2/GtrA family protein [Oscillospiraceae bacterium]
MKQVSVVLPSLDPDEKLLGTIDALLKQGFSDIILVNDGSKPENLHFFETAAQHPQVQLLHHQVNKGKGAALKTAFRWFLEHRPQAAGVVTLDGDGQHHPQDAMNCVLEMLQTGKVILGCRDFNLPQVPQRSRAGNKITCTVFKIMCGMSISDTQTGLRAIPTDAVRAFCQVKGQRFEYETNMLLALKEQGIPYGEVKIRTVYIEENASSHFRAVRDSWRIYKLILAHFFRYTLSSLLSAALDIGAYSLLAWLLRAGPHWALLTLPFVGARTLSSLFNFFMNKKLVFHSHLNTGTALLRYYALAIPVLLAQLGLTDGVYWLLRIGPHRVFFRTVIYAIVMSVLYMASFMIQQRWVFSKHPKKEEKQ